MRRLSRHAWWLARSALILGLMALQARAKPPAAPQSRPTVTVGMPAQVDQLVLPGSELEVKPLEDRRAPFVLRIKEAYPHGSAFRYDLVYYALEPGEYDLRNYLKRKDGTALGDLPATVVKVDPILPPGQVEPSPLGLARSPWLGGYRLLMAIGGSLWCAGLAAILLLGRRKPVAAEEEATRPVTLADRIKPLVDAAVAGTLSKGQHAELERLLIGYWRKRLELEQASPAEAMTVMRNHPEAGPLIRNLEEWLHRPGVNADAVDVASLLRPYQDLAAEAGERAAGSEALASSVGTDRERRL